MITFGNTPPPAARPTGHRQPGRSAEPAKPATDATGASKRFGTVLGKLERQGEGRDGPAKSAADAGLTRSPLLRRKGAGEERGEGGSAAAPTALHAAGPAASTAPALADAPIKAEIERMAAAIAEPARDATLQRATVLLPPGGVVEGAEVSRDATGAVSVRLTGFDPRVGALAAAALRRDLATALRARRLTVRDIEVLPGRRDPLAAPSPR